MGNVVENAITAKEMDCTKPKTNIARRVGR